MADSEALVLFSGGQDSTVCLAWALEQYGHVETVGFDYGQRHRLELSQRTVILDALTARFPGWRSRLGNDHRLPLPTLGAISESSLTREMTFEVSASGLPNSFVPGRNLLFFTYAAALAWRRGITRLVGGMCQTDFSGYPDCRDDTLQTLAVALTLGMGRRMVVETPLMWLSKAETWGLADRLGGAPLTELIVEETVTCYLGQRGDRHDWGYGCGTCPACLLRAKGWNEWRAGRS
jgi:7-cyano-7-deazaguanine synthase